MKTHLNLTEICTGLFLLFLIEDLSEDLEIW